VKNHTKLKLGLELHKKCPKFQCELGISIIYNDFGHAMVSYPHVKNNVVVFVVVAIVLVGPNLANFENLSSTIKITSFFSHKWRHIINSIEIFLNRPSEIGGLYNPYFFLCTYFVPWHFTHVQM